MYMLSLNGLFLEGTAFPFFGTTMSMGKSNHRKGGKCVKGCEFSAISQLRRRKFLCPKTQ